MDVGFGKVLVTGGAGFIGSHIVDRLLEKGVKVRVLDDLSTGDKNNLVQHESNDGFEFVLGDIRDYDVVEKAVEGVDAVVHQAALVSVTKSVEYPLVSNGINVVGSLNLLKASVDLGVKRFVFASSCAVYGDCQCLPVGEGCCVRPLSPYAVDKFAVENYARVFNENCGLKTVGLRYFNVYGPRQKFGPYSGVISVFVNCFLENKSPIIFGDGKQTRDFVYVDDVVEANLCALKKEGVGGEVFNVCSGKESSVNALFEVLQKVSGKSHVTPVFREERVGDIKSSYGDNSKALEKLGFKAKMLLENGIEELFKFRSKQ
ncbi:MAG: SDR family NAD(P)-dependent oxidoreductase [Candidatus Bathyarchaeota archaeon]